MLNSYPYYARIILVNCRCPYYYMYVLGTLGKFALQHNNTNNIDQGELLPTSGTKLFSSRDSNYLTRELSRSLRRTHLFGIG